MVNGSERSLDQKDGRCKFESSMSTNYSEFCDVWA